VSILRNTWHAARRPIRCGIAVAALAFAFAARADAQERLCDNAFEDCRAIILQMIRSETVGIDVSIWFMDDARYSAEIIRRWNAGVPVRVIVDLRADTNYPTNAIVRQSLVNAGIPIRYKTSPGINHWKMMLYAGQGKVHFSGANFSDGSYSPIVPYTGYVDEAVYFTDDPSVVHTFMTKYDNVWLDSANYASLANVTTLARSYPVYPLSPEMNFPPDEDYQDRLVAALALETIQVDAVMFRITSAKVPDELIRRHQAGVRVRLLTDRRQYRNPTYFWDSYNVDRMYAAGIPVKWKGNGSEQDVHQKSVVLQGRDLAVFGSSNWTSSSSDTQREHNYFTTKPWFVDWLTAQFERKWTNTQDPSTGGGPVVPAMYVDFTPLPPDEPVCVSPANEALGQLPSLTLRWEGGYWAHRYDVYFGTTPNPPLVAQNLAPGSATAGMNAAKEWFAVANLAPATTYYWRIVSKTMANRTNTGPVWSFTTSGGAPAPPAPTGFSGSALAPTRVDLQWNDVAGEEGFKIERKLSSSTTWVQIAVLAANVTTYSDSAGGLLPNSDYDYRLRAFTSGGNSDYSSSIPVHTPTAALSAGDIVLYALDARVFGRWTPIADPTAAGGSRLNNADASAATIATPLASPADYFELTFTAVAGRAYRLWFRGRAHNNSGYSDSIWAQFSGAIDAGGAPLYRIGSSAAAWVNLSECNGCALDGWGWQDNGFGVNTFGPLIRFATTGPQTIRIQVREDGFSIDQIVLSPDTFVSVSPGALRMDTVILPRQGGS
jgi:phosphatidylserine/phosphatidylglycerophosphate/cardiolipin synthase-like enzyme